MHDQKDFDGRDVMELRGQAVRSADGDEIGNFEGIFYDVDTRRPEWLALGSGALGSKRVLVPFEGAAPGGDGLTVPYSSEQVRNAPDVDRDEISRELEQQLYEYYGVSGVQEHGTTQSAGESVVRSEEELQVGKREVEAGRMRLRKWVETEPVELDLELRREVGRVRTEQINQPVSDVELGEQEIDVPLRAEQPVVAKQTIAKERVSVDRDVEVEHQRVADEVRKERVDVDTDDK
jgi:uncharacterized protein (TIGR02271 family)